MNISEFERNKPRETLKQINKVIKMSEELKKTVPELSSCHSQNGWVSLSNSLNSMEAELKKLKEIFKDGK